MVGGFFFILIQLVLVVDFAHRWAESWVEKYEETNSKAWYVQLKQLIKYKIQNFLNIIYSFRYCALIFFTFFQYALCIAAVSLFYVYYTTVLNNDKLIKDACYSLFINFFLV